MAFPRFVPFLCSGLLAPFSAHAGDAAPLAPAASPAWSYDGDENGQDDWARLSPAFASCELGTQQSPVVISNPSIRPSPRLDFNYAPSSFALSRDARHFSATPQGRQELRIAGDAYTLYRIDLHSPGEHMIRDVFYPLEIHLWHQGGSNKTLVVAAFATYGESANPVIDAMLAAAGGTGPESPRFNPASLLPQNRGYYAYTGSMTTPPCTEGVEWRVLKESISITKAQMKALARIIGRNARLTQPVYMRNISESNE